MNLPTVAAACFCSATVGFIFGMLMTRMRLAARVRTVVRTSWQRNVGCPVNRRLGLDLLCLVPD